MTKILLNISSFCFVAGICFSQDIRQTFLFADACYNSANYQEAISAYQRVVFFDNGTYRPESFRNLGNCYFALKDYDKATRYYDLAYYASSQDSVKSTLIISKATALILQEKFSEAMAELMNIDDSAEAAINKKKFFYLAIACFGMNEPDRSENYFLRCVQEEDYRKGLIIREFEKLKALKHPRVKTAKILSIIFPGAGQVYGGDIKNGINSLLINAAFIGLGFFIAKTYTPLDATLAIFPWFQRYYTGGIKKSEIIATNKLNEKRNMIYQNILDIIATSKK